MNTKSSIQRVVNLRVKIQVLEFMSEMNIDLTPKMSNFLFPLCFKIAMIDLFLMRQAQEKGTIFS